MARTFLSARYSLLPARERAWRPAVPKSLQNCSGHLRAPMRRDYLRGALPGACPERSRRTLFEGWVSPLLIAAGGSAGRVSPGRSAASLPRLNCTRHEQSTGAPLRSRSDQRRALRVAITPGKAGGVAKRVDYSKTSGHQPFLSATLDTMAEDTNQQPSAPQSPTKRLGLFDYLTVLFGIATVISLGLAYYWHAQSIQERAPTYYVSPERTRIVDISVPAPSQLQVLYKGKNLNANVSALTVYLWNDGKQPIKTDDILEPLAIRIEPGCEILDARILSVSRAVTKFSLGQVSETAKNSCRCPSASWRKTTAPASSSSMLAKPMPQRS